jgi:hypothetical protein
MWHRRIIRVQYQDVICKGDPELVLPASQMIGGCVLEPSDTEDKKEAFGSCGKWSRLKILLALFMVTTTLFLGGGALAGAPSVPDTSREIRPTPLEYDDESLIAGNVVVTRAEIGEETSPSSIQEADRDFMRTTANPPLFNWSGVPQVHQELVATNTYTYQIAMSGTVDAENTLAHGRDWISLYQPNISLKVENVSQVMVANPKVIVNGKRNWDTVDNILNEILDDTMSNKEKALAIWYFVKEHFYHALPPEDWTEEVHNPVKFLNVYGYGFCGDVAFVTMALWERAGLPSRIWNLVGHTVPGVWYDGEYHMLDPDVDTFYLLPDNETIASVEQVGYDHYLAKRTHHYGRFVNGPLADLMLTDQNVASLYGHNDVAFYGLGYPDHTMGFTLRPHESLEWRWDNIGKYHDLVDDIAPPSFFSNGKMTYEPDLDDNVYREFLDTEQNIHSVADDGQLPKLHLGGNGESGQITLKVESPYAIVGGTVVGEFYRSSPEDMINIYVSFDHQAWQKVWSADQGGVFTHSEGLDGYIAPFSTTAKYAYWVKFEFESASSATSVGLNSLRLETDVQMAPLSLPALELGLNTVVYSDETAGPHQVRITHEWQESSPTRPPAPPTAPIYPADGDDVNSTRFTFAWPAAVDPDGDEIMDYQFVLSDRPDIAWPLSSNFDRVMPTPTFEIPYDGLFNHNKRYYWHVRARDIYGVWSDWSDTWSCTPHGPAAPIDLHFGDLYTLSWSPNPSGTVPLYYEIYGSNEKGFTPDDKEHVVLTNFIPPYQSVTTLVPSNLIATTSMTSFQVIQAVPEYPNQNSYYYRVVAVDANGVRSAPTLQVEVDEPFIYSVPITSTRVGQQYQYQFGIVHSIGDLDYESGHPIPYTSYVVSYSLPIAPDWMTIDERTGRVMGVPRLGEFDAAVQAVDSLNQMTHYQPFHVTVDKSLTFLPFVQVVVERKIFLPLVMIGGSQ